MRVRQADVLVETTATGALVCDPVLRVVHRLDTRHAHYLHTAATTGELPDDPITRHLIERSILHELPELPELPESPESPESRELPESLGLSESPDQDPDDDTSTGTGSRTSTGAAPTFTRRSVLAASITAGITTLALPEAAAASSTSGTPAPASGGGGGSPATTTTVAATTTTESTTTTTTVPLPAAPTSTPVIGRSTSTRKVRVVWSSTPEAFTYNWIIYNTDSTPVVQASGIAESASTGTFIYTMPAGVVKFRVDVTSNTSPPVSVSSDQTF